MAMAIPLRKQTSFMNDGYVCIPCLSLQELDVICLPYAYPDVFPGHTPDVKNPVTN